MTLSTSSSFAEIFASVRAESVRAVQEGLRARLADLAASLVQASGAARSDRESQVLHAAAAMLRVDPQRRIARVGERFQHLVEVLLEAARQDGEAARADALVLLDEQTLEAQLVAQPLAQALSVDGAPGYQTWSALVRRISPNPWNDDVLNPLGARVLAQALVAGIDDLLDVPVVRSFLAEWLRTDCAPFLSAMIVAGNQHLEALGVRAMAFEPTAAARDDSTAPPTEAPDPPALPNIPGPVPPSPPAETVPTDAPLAVDPIQASAAAIAAPETDEHGRFVERASSAEHDARTLGISPLAGFGADQRLRVLPTLQPVVEIERDAVAFAHSIGEVAYSRQARSRYFANVRERLAEAAAAPAQLAIVDVVAAMFDYVVDDRNLPDPVHPLLWRLQQPALVLALLDPGYLGDEPRSLRRLIENFGAIANGFGDELSRGSELHRRMDIVVRAVEIVTSALQTRSAVMSRQVTREYTRAATNVRQLVERIVRERTALEAVPSRRNRRDYASRPDQAQEREATVRVEQLLDERLAGQQVPDSVRDFLSQVWLRHLRTAFLRSGEDSGDFRAASQVVDDLLWSLGTADTRPVSRRELVERIPPLIRLLTQGLRAVGSREDEYRGLFDELFLIHLRRLHRHERGVGAPTVSAIIEAGETAAVATREDRGHGPSGAAATSGARDSSDTGPGASLTTSDSQPRVTRRAGSVGPDDRRRILEQLKQLDLSDLPAVPRRASIEADTALARLACGDWIELIGRDGESRYLKLGWLAPERTIALFVRHADRRAWSVQMSDIARRLRSGKAFLLEPPS